MKVPPGRLLAIAALGSLCLAAGVAAAPTKPWERLKDQASILEVNHHYSQSIELYKQALRLVPAADELCRLQILCALADCYKKVLDGENTCAVLDQIEVLAKTMQTNGKLGMEAQFSLGFLLDDLDRGLPYVSPGGDARKRLKASRLIQGHVLKLTRSVMPGRLTPPRMLSIARVSVADGDLQAAEAQLVEFMKTLPANSPFRPDFVGSLAACRARQGKPEAISALLKSLEKKGGKIYARRELAKYYYWSADYPAAFKVLDEAVTLLGPRPDVGQLEELLASKLKLSQDSGNVKMSEEICNKRIHNLRPCRKQYPDLYRTAVTDLYSLVKVVRPADAARVLASSGLDADEIMKPQAEMFITERDRLEMEKAKGLKTGKP
ncbi:MAG TPA: hypothetical protein PLC15_00190 [Candidatus Obscuribacter sp.]|nr:hypothetical protein [Candidatus Obscuribacter sp.]HMX44468.1 hypothetical protein [Candidatus Obscuribacter sp.]HMY04198.1 hypothetical protein [Candidatus Obscuribacter sp.]HMY52529.1 hypothetical protein [Candidatus Obscuribacter sp.]HNB13761.1 hypothetical protein [Candidatus Obscuribacter sp.]